MPKTFESAAGGRRRKYDVELFVETLDSLEDQYDLLADLEAKQMVDVLVAHLDVLGLDKVKELVPWMLRNAEGHELIQRVRTETQYDHHAVLSRDAQSSQSGRHFVGLKHYRWAFKTHAISAIMTWTDAA